MNKPTIAIDVDEVLFPLLASFFSYLKAAHDIDIVPDQMETYRTEDVIGGTSEDLLAKMDAYMQTEHYENTSPVIGAVEALKQLHINYRLIIVTARHKNFSGFTERFIETHFKGLFDNVHYTHDVIDPGVNRPKAEMCKELQAITLVDDSLRNVIECAEAGIPSVVFGDYRWNQSEELPEGVTRCVDWEAVEEYFHGIRQ